MIARNFLKRIVFVSLALAFGICMFAGVAQAKSVYLVADHHSGAFDGYSLARDGTISFQYRTNLVCCEDPAGVLVWEEFDEFGVLQRAYLFLTSEFCAYVEAIDALTLAHVACVAHGATELAGIGMDNKNMILYAIEREANRLYAFDWDPDVPSLTPRPGFPVTLPGVSVGFGLALDWDRGIVYVSDVLSEMVKGFDLASLPGVVTEVFSWEPTSVPVDVGIDVARNILYTTHPDGGCFDGQPVGTTYTCRYDIANGVETTGSDPKSMDGMGVAVDESSGYIYLTHGCDANHVSVWDASVTPWTQIQIVPGVGNPAGIAIGKEAKIPGDPDITVYTNIAADSCLQRGDDVTINVLYEYVGRDGSSPAQGVEVLVDLAPHLDFISATGGGVYDPVAHQVYWDVGTMDVDDSYAQQIMTEVSAAAEWGEVLTTWGRIQSVFPDRFIEDDTFVRVCAEPEYRTVALDIKPTSCPNPFNTNAQGKLPVAVLGTENFDVRSIDPSTIMLEGVPVLGGWYRYDDVATPFDGILCDCHELGADGYMDLKLKFDRQALVAAIEAMPSAAFVPAMEYVNGGPDGRDVALSIGPREYVHLTLTGMTWEGTPIVGEDCVRVMWHTRGPNEGDDAGGSEIAGLAITEVSLAGGNPNPFASETRIAFSLPAGTHVSLSVFDVAGRMVKTLVDEEMPQGVHSITWNRTDDAGTRLPGGVYFCRMSARGFDKVTKLIVAQ